MTGSLDALASRWERKLGSVLLVSAWVGLLMVAAAIYVRPATSTTSLGVQYAQLSLDPWAVFRETARMSPPHHGGVEHRLLTPVISWSLGLRGNKIIITNLLAAAILLAAITSWFRRFTPRLGDAFFASAVIAFSLVTLTTIYYGGYCDSLTYLIVFVMYLVRSRPVPFYLLFLLGMLNHESIAFLLPWFALVTRDSYPSSSRWLIGTAVGVGVVMLAYSGYRGLLAARMTAGSVGDYLGPLLSDPLYWWRRSWPYQGLGLLSVFKLTWVFPCVAVWSLLRRGRGREAVAIALPVVCAAAQFVVAYDSSRLFTLSFMAMILALLYLFRENPLGFRRWAGAVFLVNLAIPQVFTAGKMVEVMVPTLARIIQRM